MKRIIKKILKEEWEPTETEYLGINIPDYLIGQLDIRSNIKNDTDLVAITEIHFDTKSVVIELYERDEKYDEWDNYNGITVSIKSLSLEFIKFIIGELDRYYSVWLFPFLDILDDEVIQALRNRNIKN
jgi:hypothetical protein